MKKFLIPPVKMPTEAEMKAIALKWWSHNVGTNFLDWNEEMRNHTFPYRIISWDKKLLNDHIDAMDGKREKYKDIIKSYAKMLRKPLKEMDCKYSFFLKLISRSPKDFLADSDNHGMPRPLHGIKDAVTAISNSMRCFEDIVLLRYLDIASIVVRPYIHFDAKDEWRVYIKDKKIVGVSQYYYGSKFPELTTDEVERVDEEIRNIINTVAIPNIKIDDYIADVIVGSGKRKTVILETNPYWLSDPCLFKNYESFDGSTIWLTGSRISKLKR